MSEDKNTKTNIVGIGHNNTYSKEQYEKLLSRFHYIMDFARSATHDVEHLFDEAFTGYKNSRSFDTKLKTFEVHEKRQRAKSNAAYLVKALHKESETVEAKAKANGLKLEVVEERKAAQEECDRLNAKHKAEDEAN